MSAPTPNNDSITQAVIVAAQDVMKGDCAHSVKLIFGAQTFAANKNLALPAGAKEIFRVAASCRMHEIEHEITLEYHSMNVSVANNLAREAHLISAETNIPVPESIEHVVRKMNRGYFEPVYFGPPLVNTSRST